MKYAHFIHDRRLFLKLEGDFLGDTEEEHLLQMVENYLQFSVLRCVIDLGGVQHMNSTGLSFLVRIFNRISEKKGTMVILNTAPHIVKLLQVTKLSSLFHLASSREEAWQLV